MKKLTFILITLLTTACGVRKEYVQESFGSLNGTWTFTGKYCTNGQCVGGWMPSGCSGLNNLFNSVTFENDKKITLNGQSLSYSRDREGGYTVQDGRYFIIYLKSSELDKAIVQPNSNCSMEFERQ